MPSGSHFKIKRLSFSNWGRTDSMLSGDASYEFFPLILLGKIVNPLYTGRLFHCHIGGAGGRENRVYFVAFILILPENRVSKQCRS